MQKVDVDEAVVAAVLSEAKYILCTVGVGVGRLAAFLVQKVSQLYVVANGVLKEMQADSNHGEWLLVVSVALLMTSELSARVSLLRSTEPDGMMATSVMPGTPDGVQFPALCQLPTPLQVRVTDSISSFRIFTVACPSAIRALTALLRFTTNVSNGYSSSVSPSTGTVIVPDKVNGGMVNVPLVAV